MAEEEAEVLRRATRTGRLLGSAAFVKAMEAKPARPLILDLLPQTAWSSIARVTVDSGNMEFYACLVVGDDGKWRVKGRPRIIVDPADITEFTVYQGEDTTTWTEGSHANEWSCTIERKVTT